MNPMENERPPSATDSRTDFWLGVGAALYVAWYLGGIVIFATNWLPSTTRAGVTGWGDCVFLSMAGCLTFLIARRDFGIRDVASAAVFALAASAAVEIIGVKTGFPFGDYRYTGLMGAQVFGIPWIIPVCWFIILINAYIVISALVVSRGEEVSRDAHLLLILLTALVVTLTDVNLEPVAVNVRLYWFWMDMDRVFYGIPRLNFFGWFAISVTLASALVHILDPRRWRPSTAWVSLALLASLQLFFAILNWRAHQFIPVFVSLNLTGFLAIGLAWKQRSMKEIGTRTTDDTDESSDP